MDFMRGDSIVGHDFLTRIGPVFFPSFDLIETAEQFTLMADLPGLSLDDLDIALNGDAITITGERESENVKDAASCHALERTFGSFHRSFNLPGDLDASQWTAKMNNGVLRVIVPKRFNNLATAKAPDHGPVPARSRHASTMDALPTKYDH